jgi:hypothetical protein
LFLLYINDLPLGINTDSKLLLYADDTSVLVSGTNIQELQTKSTVALDNINNWLMRNGLSLNLKKTKLIKFNSNYLNNVPFQIPYKDKLIQEEINTNFLGLEIDKHMNCKPIICLYNQN